MRQFTPQQEHAAKYLRQDACVVAGPGSGKTTVLVERYANLLREGLTTDQILAITFTEKAAANMMSRLAKEFEHDQARRQELESAYVSTIHGFCSRLLKQNAVAAQIDPRFTVLDARQSERLQQECLAEAVNHLAETRRAETLQLIEALHYAELIGPLQSIYDAMRSSGMTVEQLRAKQAPGEAVTLPDVITNLGAILRHWNPTTAPQRNKEAEFIEWISRAPRMISVFTVWDWIKDKPRRSAIPAAHDSALRELYDATLPALLTSTTDAQYLPLREAILDTLARFDTAYRTRKQEQAALDFNDLESRAIQLLRHRGEVRERMQQQFRQIMLDEFQDINDQQWQLLELLRAPDTFFAVGDINQSIYGFRHAQPEIFERYQRDTQHKHYTELFANFRSRKEVLAAVETILADKPGIQPRQLEAGKKFPEKRGPFVEVIRAIAADKDDAAALEASWIAHKLLRMRNRIEVGEPGKTRPADYKDFAVLTRTGEAMRPVIAAFEQAGIPYVSSRQDSFLISREGLDLTALLHVISNPRDEIQFATVLRSPLVAVSDEALLQLRLAGKYGIHEALRHLDQVELQTEDLSKLQRFHTNLNRWRQEQLVLALDLVLLRALEDQGYDWSPESLSGSNIESFLHLARTTGTSMPLTDFLIEIESLSEAVDKEADLADEDQGNRVQVLTAHAAKGLEFPVVFVAAMDKEGRKGTGNLNFTPQHGLGIRWRDPKGSNDGIKDSWHAANGELVKAREEAETNRLLYVAMTRAEEHLILSFAATDRASGEWSSYLDEFYDVKKRVPAPEPFLHEHESFETLVLVTDSDPPALTSDPSELRDREGVLVLRRPRVTGQYDSAVNVTALAVFGQCPRKYYLQRYVGAKPGRLLDWDPDSEPEDGAGELHDTDEPPTAAELGTQTHALLAGMEGPYPPEARRLAEVFFRSDLARQANSAEQAAREWEFIVEIEGILVRGVIDLWFTSQGETTIVDYKTDSIRPTEITARAATYAPQLALYGLALKKEPIRAWLYFLQPDLPVEITLDYEAARALVRSLTEAQESGNFPLAEGPHCFRCPYYRSQCPAGRG